MPNFIRLFVSCLLLVLVVSCSTPNNPGNNAAPTETDALDLVTLDDKFLQVAKQSPGFGGMFYDGSGNLNVYTTRPQNNLSVQTLRAQENSVRAAIGSVFGPDVFRVQRSSGRNGVLSSASTDANLKVVKARFNFVDLAKWYASVREAISSARISDVVFTDIEETNNRIAVGIAKGSGKEAARLKQELLKRGIPPAAVTIKQVERAAPTLKLTQRLRPVRAGTQIDLVPGAFPSLECTLGFNAYSNKFARWGFVTNSHCTSTYGVVDATNRSYQLYQSQAAVQNDLIGVEHFDPWWLPRPQQWRLSDGQVHTCYANEYCRWSDSAFIRYNATTSFSRGLISRTQFGSRTFGSLDVDSNNPAFRIVRKKYDFFIGSNIPLNKVGRTTGWTYGYITQTCSDVYLSGYRLLCQYQTNAGDQGGDSGSPVFSYYNDGTADLYGLAWGNQGIYRMWFSPINNVEHELGTLNVF